MTSSLSIDYTIGIVKILCIYIYIYINHLPIESTYGNVFIAFLNSDGLLIYGMVSSQVLIYVDIDYW